MTNHRLLDKKTKVELLENMLAVALIDGTFEEAEKTYFYTRAQEYGFSCQDVANLLIHSPLLQGSPQDVESRMSIPRSALYTEEMLADAIFMSLSNGEMSPKEYTLCRQLSEIMGMEKSDLDEVIDYVSKVYIKLDK